MGCIVVLVLPVLKAHVLALSRTNGRRAVIYANVKAFRP